MVKQIKVVVVGGKSVGKTSILERAILGSLRPEKPYIPTIEDIYVGHVETDKTHKEKVRFYDTAGLDASNRSISQHYHALADAFILVFSVIDYTSFKILEDFRRDIEKYREKKEIPITVLANKCDIKRDRAFDHKIVEESWALSDPSIKIWETSIHNRQSLLEPIIQLASKFIPQPNRSSFPQLSISRKNKD